MKPIMNLDPSLPKTRKVPVNPETGNVWSERQDELGDLYWRWQEAEEDEAEHEARWQALRDQTQWTDEVVIFEYTITMGAGAALQMPPGKTPKIPKMLGCHPEIWAKVPADVQAQYDVRTSLMRGSGQTIDFTTA
jgi:hypothetical protein